MKTVFRFFSKKVKINFSNLNIFYGYSASGKTLLSQTLNQGLSGKDKNFTIDGMTVVKGDRNIYYIDSKESIIDHLKLTTKSYLRRFYYSSITEIIDKNDINLVETINNLFTNINSEIKEKLKLENIAKKISISASIEVPSLKSFLDNFLTVEFNEENLSSSSAKELLFILLELIKEDEGLYDIIIDDFDSSLDEESTIKILNLIENSKNNYYLFTNKPESLPYVINYFNIYVLRDENLMNITNLTKYIKESSRDTLSKNETYEEYLLNDCYFECTNEIQKLIKTVFDNSIFNIGRMITNKNYTFSPTFNYKEVIIVPKNNDESKFLLYFDKLINKAVIDKN